MLLFCVSQVAPSSIKIARIASTSYDAPTSIYSHYSPDSYLTVYCGSRLKPKACKHESLWCAYKCAQHIISNNRNLVACYWRSLFFLVVLKHVPIKVIQELFKDACVIIELSRVLVTSAELWTVHAANKGGVALSAAQ